MREYNGFRSFHVSTELLPSSIASAEAARRALSPSECALIVIDIQEKLLSPIFERERVVKNSQLLIRAAGILKIPTIATTQYAKGLGETVPDVKSLLPNDPIDKQMFSCFGSDVFCSALKEVPHVSPGLRIVGRRNTLLLCGMESHICVAQTALAALREGHLVHVASDAVSSRTEWNWKIGLDRMRAAGAVISSTEMIIYELLRSSGTEEFKKMLAYLK
jgi:nicotinamidase-related amidase